MPQLRNAFSEREHRIQEGLEKYKEAHYEEIPLSKLLIGSKIQPVGLVKIKTHIPPRVSKNKYGEYLVIDGRHRVFEFYLNHLSLPHNIKIGCLVEDDPKDRHYSGYHVWQAGEAFPIKPRRSMFRRFFNFFGLFRVNPSFFSLEPQNRKVLSRRSLLLLDLTEDKLDALYDDFITRICDFMALVQKKKYINSPDPREFKKYESLLEELVGEEQQEKSLLQKLLDSLNNDTTRLSSPETDKVKEIIQIISGNKDDNGLITVFKTQLEIIKSGRFKENEHFEKDLISELRYARNLLISRREKLLHELREVVYNMRG